MQNMQKWHFAQLDKMALNMQKWHFAQLDKMAPNINFLRVWFAMIMPSLDTYTKNPC